MNPRATLILLVVTLAVLGGLYTIRHTVEPTREAEENRRFAAIFEPEDVREIDITRGNETVSLHREGTGWRLTAPVADRASPEAVDRLLMAARFMEVHDRQPGRDPSKFSQAGLVPPRFRIELRGGKNTVINIGAATALPQEVFAHVGSGSGVLRVADTIAGLADDPVDLLRDPRLTEFVADDIEKFTVRRADGEMTLRHEHGRWVIDRPVQAPADPQAVRAFLEPLLGARILSFGLQAAESPAAALPNDEASVSFTPRGGGDDLELRIHGHGNGGKQLSAFFMPRGGDIIIDGAASSLFKVSPEALRDKSLGHVDVDAVDRIRLESDGTSVTLRREGQGEGWIGDADGRRRTAEDIDRLVTAFNETKVSAFRTAEGAEETGLAAPAQKVLFYSWLSENTPEDTAGGRLIAGVEIGSVAPGGGVYARGAGSDETVTVPETLRDAVRNTTLPPNTAGSPH